MSDTAKEFWDRLAAIAGERSMDAVTSCAWLFSLATEVIARIELLERGIERANKSSAYIPDGINLPQLIEELGREQK